MSQRRSSGGETHSTSKTVEERGPLPESLLGFVQRIGTSLPVEEIKSLLRPLFFALDVIDTTGIPKLFPWLGKLFATFAT
jgi:hypothetical protein